MEVIPLSKVSNLLCGRFKPFILLVLAAIMFLAAFATFGLTLILTVIFVIYYQKSLATAKVGGGQALWKGKKSPRKAGTRLAPPKAARVLGRAKRALLLVAKISKK